MDTDIKKFAPPKLLSAFHLLGAAGYTSVDARNKYAKSLMRFSGKMFWSPVAAILATAYTHQFEHIFVLWAITILLCAGAIYTRHYALVIFDNLPAKPPRTAKRKEAQSV